MKKISIFLLINVFVCTFSQQSNFEYERTWGTYLGPSGGYFPGLEKSRGILFDSSDNLHISGGLYPQNLADTYFNQFVLGGGSLYNNTQGFTDRFMSVINSTTGTPSYYGYQYSNSSTMLEEIDSDNNRFYLIYGASPSVQATLGVYLSSDPQPSSPHKTMLAKYSPTGTLLWATYLPSASRAVSFEVDGANNIYVNGVTVIDQNVSTNGVFQENYDVLYDGAGNLVPNGYLLKLSSAGQRIWGTYLPNGVSNSMQYYGNSLYLLSGSNINPALNTMATPGAFQSSTAPISITKINASTGLREWGTYYGPSASSGLVNAVSLAVNETGLYVTGTDYNFDGTSFFGTSTSYKQYVTGGSDLFLSKFSLSGSREWSTYFGSSAEDMNEFDKVIALNGGDIYITGNTYGVGSNIATPGSYQSSPESNTVNSYNFYFVKFTSSGNLSWASYYGGTTTNTGQLTPLNVAFKNNTLYLYGATNSNNGYTTEGAYMPQRNPSNTNALTCFVAKFNNKNTMGTSETDLVKDLFMYDNPNNGNFSLQGSVLTKKNCTLKLYDAAGRLVYSAKLNNQQKQSFEMHGILQKGNYIAEVNDQSTILKTFKMIVK